MRAVVLMPAHNEAAHISASVKAAESISGVHTVIVVDDASRDQTAALAEAAGADVVALTKNRGKGGALDAGLARVRQRHPDDALLLLDADLGETAAQGGRLLSPVLSHDADMTIATFPDTGMKAGFGLVMNLARAGFRVLGGSAGRAFPAEAPLSGQRAMSPLAWNAIAPFAFGYGAEVAMTVRALRAGLRVVEVQTQMTHAATGRDLRGFLHRGRQFAHVAWALVRLTFERRRR